MKILKRFLRVLFVIPACLIDAILIIPMLLYYIFTGKIIKSTLQILMESKF